MELLVTRDVINLIRTEAARSHPLECCGIMLGKGTTLTAAIPARNVHPRPQTHFEIDPQALIDAHRAARSGGPAVLGYYHSHPTGDPAPSAIDRAEAARDGAVWAIVTPENDVAFWRDDESGFTALPYEVDDG